MNKATFMATLHADRAAWDAMLAELLPLGEAALIAPGATGAWSVKDVIAHITWFEREMVGMVRARALVGSELWNLSPDARNAAIFAQNRDRLLPDVLAEAERVYAELLAAVEALMDEDLADPARFAGMPADWQPWRVIAGNSFEHYRDHTPALRGWLATHRMRSNARYVHTNLIARDWQTLAAFYQEVFGCVPAGTAPERDLSGPDLEAGVGIPGAHLRGVHLRLPGYGEDGPTLEIFNYNRLADRPPIAVNRPGYGHIAFSVDDVARARAAVLAAGGQPVGKIVTLPLPDGARVTWCYVTDPEGNVIELQSWSR